MPRHSAGLLPYRIDDAGVRVFLAHMGGPFWARKDAAAWTIVKGEFDPDRESAEQAARREWCEETGAEVPGGPLLPLGDVRQSGAKIVTAFAVEAPAELAFVASNQVEIEWPPRSGRRLSVPEIDRAEWFGLEEAAQKILKGQVPLLLRLAELLAG